MKGIVSGVQHKTERGLVRLDLRDKGALARAYQEITGERWRHRLIPIVVQEMLPTAPNSSSEAAATPSLVAR